MLIPVNEMTIENEGNEQKVISWLVREGWRNGEMPQRYINSLHAVELEVEN